ncbi:MAG: hypothetical protein J2P13_02705 [Acidobacteria bacterium]|nr:hypothetical protein [Acidobacteriota bacterium]
MARTCQIVPQTCPFRGFRPVWPKNFSVKYMGDWLAGKILPSKVRNRHFAGHFPAALT